MLVSLDHRWIAELAVRYPVFEARLRRALSISRERLAWVSGVKQELLDFFVRQGISVSGEMVRVRQLGLCIDCKLCEEACEERYGARRLTLGGYQLGMLDFIYTCRTCTDQRCIDPCAYDSIKFDEVKKEVVINESTCTGCTACAQACPYGAIDMVEIEPDAPTFKKDFKAAAREEGRAEVRPGHAARRARPPDREQVRSLHRVRRSGVRVGVPDRLADRDQRVRPVPRALAEDGAARAAPATTPISQKKDRKEVLPVMPFTEGVAVRSGGLAKVKRGRYAPLLIWMRRPLRVPGRARRGAAARVRADDVVPVQPARGDRRSTTDLADRADPREGHLPPGRPAVDVLRPDRHRAHDHRRDLSDLPADQAVPLAGLEHDVVRLPPDGRHRRPDVHRRCTRRCGSTRGSRPRSGAW